MIWSDEDIVVQTDTMSDSEFFELDHSSRNLDLRDFVVVQHYIISFKIKPVGLENVTLLKYWLTYNFAVDLWEYVTVLDYMCSKSILATL